jgi:hypothetical protein
VFFSNRYKQGEQAEAVKKAKKDFDARGGTGNPWESKRDQSADSGERKRHF